MPVFDPRGNRGKFNLDLNFEHLSNITFDVRVAPQQMLVLNTTEEDNDLFYGRVHATGGARITGRKGVVEMEIAASTDSNSDFYLPLSGKSNISDADFVIFEKPVRTDSLDAVARRKLSFERRHRQHQTAASRMSIGLALDVRPNANVELTLAGNTLKAKGSGTLNLQINPSANIFEIYGDYTLSEGSFLLSLQNIISKRFTIENGSSIQWTGAPMDARLDIDAVYKLKASLQPLLQGTTRQPRRQPLGARGVRHPPRRPALEPGHRLRRPRPGLRPRNADGHRQCALNARDGRYAICLPAVVQQLHGGKLLAGFLQHRQLRIGRNGHGFPLEHGQRVVLLAGLRLQDRIPSPLRTDERRGGLRHLEEPRKRPAAGRGRRQLPDRQQAGDQQLDVQLHGRGLPSPT